MRIFRLKAVGLLALLVLPNSFQGQSSPEKVVIEAHAPGSPFPHFWEQTFGSGRAILTLRESYRSDLREVKKVTEFRYVRFHNILHDEVGVYDEDEQGNPIYNFSYVDQIYDGLLANGVRPFVEISFMPKKLAARQDVHPFWYKPIVSPPKDYAKWDALMRALAQHLVERYGIDEVAQWYFEVWNEPNIDFWTGEPKRATYFELYDHTARALKAVNSRLRVGGPATSSAHWVDDFIRHTAALRRRYGRGFVWDARGHSHGSARLPVHQESARSDRGLGASQSAVDVDGVECALVRAAACARYGVCGGSAG